MTKTFADQAQTYFENYRQVIEEMRETEATISKLQRRHQDLQVQKNHMSRIIVNHIDSGDDIMMCSLHAEKPGALGPEESVTTTGSMRISSSALGSYTSMYNSSINPTVDYSSYPLTTLMETPVKNQSVSMSKLLARAAAPPSGAYGDDSGVWKSYDIGMDSIDIRSAATDATGSNKYNNP
ncbi:hypothetical protein UFOVP29_396 [uncultured Caudovirales phage]|uniref:Uncharacterized protein n=1 Tax=uncultured Caudovirales phage TaxID=2100421 RepID=A0A6J5KQY5_9CAUD|nr:hypothetical protein UFOVP29_396 [uncultured Caudovirales phage]